MYLPAAQATPERLFTPAGVKALERALKPRRTLLLSPECRSMDVVDRVALVVQKGEEDRATDRAGAAGGGLSAQAEPERAHASQHSRRQGIWRSECQVRASLS